MMKTFFYNGHVLKEINRSLNTLIPKVDNLDDANPAVFCFEIHQLLWIALRIFKYNLEQWPCPLDY